MLHQLFRAEPAPPPGWEEGPEAPSRAASARLASLLAGWEEPGEGGWSAFYRVVGGEADYLILHLRPDLESLGEAERTLRMSGAIPHLTPVGDYLSVVELGLYSATASLLKEAGEEGIAPGSPEWDERAQALLAAESGKRYVQERLRPIQPEEMPYICFYPMDKRRSVGQNWYTLPLGERAALMRDHGATGRRYAGKVSQVISGSIGFDDWEWAVTLFSADPLHFKSLVTEMRYDEVSSVYADFGNFRVGHRIPASRIEAELEG